MKKFKLKKILVLAMTVVMVFGCINMPSHAITTDWQNATEITGKIDTDAITSATDENWYKFTTTTANLYISIRLEDMPSENAYGIELRYQETAGARPIILENTAQISNFGRKYMYTTLEAIGTYYIRVYSITGEYDTMEYVIALSKYPNGTFTNVDEAVYCDGQNYDWAACAEMLGKMYYKDVFDAELTTRNYKNAARFVQSAGADDNANSASAVRGSLQDTLLAVNYMFAGDYMAEPVFKITNEITTAEDFSKYIWQRNGERGELPVLIRIAFNAAQTADVVARYMLVTGYDASNGTIDMVDPDTTSRRYLVPETLALVNDDGTASTEFAYYNEAIILA